MRISRRNYSITVRENLAGEIAIGIIDRPKRTVGMDERLATHFAHLFIRDPLAVFKEALEASPERLADHFEVRENLLPLLYFEPSHPANVWVVHTIYKLAAYAFQAPTTWRQHWLES